MLHVLLALILTLYKVGARYCDPATRRFNQRLIDSKPPSTGMLSGGVLPLATGG